MTAVKHAWCLDAPTNDPRTVRLCGTDHHHLAYFWLVREATGDALMPPCCDYASCAQMARLFGLRYGAGNLKKAMRQHVGCTALDRAGVYAQCAPVDGTAYRDVTTPAPSPHPYRATGQFQSGTTATLPKVQPTKNCEECGGSFTRPVGISSREWDTRRYCGGTCRNASKQGMRYTIAPAPDGCMYASDLARDLGIPSSTLWTRMRALGLLTGENMRGKRITLTDAEVALCRKHIAPRRKKAA